jgi:hypothetical protein
MINQYKQKDIYLIGMNALVTSWALQDSVVTIVFSRFAINTFFLSATLLKILNSNNVKQKNRERITETFQRVFQVPVRWLT